MSCPLIPRRLSSTFKDVERGVRKVAETNLGIAALVGGVGCLAEVVGGEGAANVAGFMWKMCQVNANMEPKITMSMGKLNVGGGKAKDKKEDKEK